ncbi:MAG: hypothetical protein H6733_05510 [Alphaproteobacteria bacterium]|nr:hypothetical protein [Alphaproteobacteria bacterium]
MPRALWLLVAGGLLAGCPNNSDGTTTKQVWVRFNGDDAIPVVVTAGACDPTPLVTDLMSTTGETRIGTVTLDPPCGPVGTEHRITVDLLTRDFGARVQRAEIDAASGDRGTWRIELEQDSADERVWVRDVTSYGTAGEEREDTFYILLYEVQEETLPVE